MSDADAYRRASRDVNLFMMTGSGDVCPTMASRRTQCHSFAEYSDVVGEGAAKEGRRF